MDAPPTVADPLATRKERGREVLRHFATQTAAEYRERPTTARTAQVVRLARAGGLTTAELERVTGLGRQTLHDLYGDERDAPSENPRLQLLALLAAEGPAVPTTLAPSLGLDVSDVDALLEGLRRDGLLERSPAGGSEPETYIWAYHLTPVGDRALEEAERHSELRGDHSSGWSIFMKVDEDEADALLAAARAISGRYGADLLGAYVSSYMAGPELGIMVNAIDVRDALQIAHRVFEDITERAVGVARRPGQVADFAPPSRRPTSAD